MTRTLPFLIIALALAAGPCAAAVSSGDQPAAASRQTVAPDIERLLTIVADNSHNELPLECRGYHLRMKTGHGAAARLERCE